MSARADIAARLRAIAAEIERGPEPAEARALSQRKLTLCEGGWIRLRDEDIVNLRLNVGDVIVVGRPKGVQGVLGVMSVDTWTSAGEECQFAGFDDILAALRARQ